jgi:hypothetical protein
MAKKLTVEVVFIKTENPVRLEAGLRAFAKAAVRFSQKRADSGQDSDGDFVPSGFPLLNSESADAEETPQFLLSETQAGAGRL